MKREVGLPRRVASGLREWPPAYWAARRAFTAANRMLPPRVLDGIPGPVHRNDLMLDHRSAWSRDNYLTAAKAAVALVREALEDVGGDLAESDVLDFGCGHGRVVRHLVSEARTVDACDLDGEGVRFCASAFGATPVLGSVTISDVVLRNYDAAWAGSVITHHPPEVCISLLETLAEHVRPGGVLVVTSADELTLTHELGAPGQEWLRWHETALRRDLSDLGAAFVAYPQSETRSYGLGFQTDEWLDDVLSGAGLSLLWHRSQGWGVQAAHAWRQRVTTQP